MLAPAGWVIAEESFLQGGDYLYTCNRWLSCCYHVCWGIKGEFKFVQGLQAGQLRLQER